MAEPPKTNPSELWRRLSARPRPSRVVEFPARGDDGGAFGAVRVQVLRVDEIDDARFAAEEWLRKRTKTPDSHPIIMGETTREVLADRVACEVLARATLTVDPIPESEPPVFGRHFFGADDVRKKLSPDELLVLFNQYQLTQLESGPLETQLTSDEVEAWVDRLTEAASTVPLAPLSWVALAKLCLSLADAVSSGREPQESLSTPSPDSSDSQDANSPSGTSSSGEPLAELSPRRVDDLYTPAEAALIATKIFR